jgi:hypothetical protein
MSLHAHIIFWLHHEDLTLVSNNIMAYVPDIYDKGTKAFTKPFNSLE